jgi:hypothetical protein
MTARKFSKSRRVALAGGAAVVLGGAVAGAAMAKQPAPPLEPMDEDILFIAEGQAEPIKLKQNREAWLNALANKPGVTSDKLEQALEEVAKEQGFRGPPMVPFGPGIAAFTPGAETFTIEIDPGLAAAARALGMTEDQLRKEWPSKSLTDIARARNVDPRMVADAITAQRRADLDRAVADKQLSADMANRLKSHLDMAIDRFMQRGGVPLGPHPFIHIERVIRGD